MRFPCAVNDTETYDTGTMGRRVANLTALQYRELAFHALGFDLGGSDHVERSNTLAIKTSVLSKTLPRKKASYCYISGRKEQQRQYPPDISTSVRHVAQSIAPMTT